MHTTIYIIHDLIRWKKRVKARGAPLQVEQFESTIEEGIQVLRVKDKSNPLLPNLISDIIYSHI